MRYTGLRISDVAALERDRIQGGQMLLHTQKTGGTVFLPVPGELQDALDRVPLPRNGGAEARCFFWNGITSKRGVVGIAERTLAAVFAKSKSGFPLRQNPLCSAHEYGITDPPSVCQ